MKTLVAGLSWKRRCSQRGRFLRGLVRCGEGQRPLPRSGRSSASPPRSGGPPVRARRAHGPSWGGPARKAGRETLAWEGTWCACRKAGPRRRIPPRRRPRPPDACRPLGPPGPAESRGRRLGPSRHGSPGRTFTGGQLVLFHGRQAEHVRVLSRVAFIKGLNVDGEFLHKGASEPAVGRRASISPGWCGSVD